MRVRWLRVALANLNEEAEFIARDNPRAAAALVNHIVTAVNGLKRHTAKGRPGRVEGTRELVIPGTPYVVPYRVRRDTVEILRIFHGARKWPSHL